MARRSPKTIEIPLIKQAERLLTENEALAETMDSLYKQAAESLYRKYSAYLRAGFSAEQAFELCKPK